MPRSYSPRCARQSRGTFGTNGWIDPEKKLITVFMVQNVLVPKGGELRDKFIELTAGAVK